MSEGSSSALQLSSSSIARTTERQTVVTLPYLGGAELVQAHIPSCSVLSLSQYLCCDGLNTIKFRTKAHEIAIRQHVNVISVVPPSAAPYYKRGVNCASGDSSRYITAVALLL